MMTIIKMQGELKGLTSEWQEVFMIIYISKFTRHTHHNEHTRVLAVRCLLQTCSVVAQWRHPHRAACASAISTCFVIYIARHDAFATAPLPQRLYHSAFATAPLPQRLYQ